MFTFFSFLLLLCIGVTLTHLHGCSFDFNSIVRNYLDFCPCFASVCVCVSCVCVDICANEFAGTFVCFFFHSFVNTARELSWLRPWNTHDYQITFAFFFSRAFSFLSNRQLLLHSSSSIHSVSVCVWVYLAFFSSSNSFQ